ncbi:hypothetical protein [Alteromonas sp. 5E99-2]|uniref:hypothetical protein n=1 Tax=Alteromonas sp. 5E99-2 TaxID=2817683 RepID=UPI001A97DAAC|nr:hypothetical protein [Alteromonas sp. 5E99-2]
MTSKKAGYIFLVIITSLFGIAVSKFNPALWIIAISSIAIGLLSGFIFNKFNKK